MNIKPIQKKVEFDPKVFDSTNLRDCVNCYAYAINAFDIETKLFIGIFSNYSNELKVDDLKLVNRFIKDMIALEKDPIKSNLESKPNKGYYKIALLSNYGTTRSSITDFHFARQDNDGNWSHKVRGRYPEIINTNEFNNLLLRGDIYHLVGVFDIKEEVV